MAVDFDTLTGSKSTEGSIKFLANHETLPVANILIEAQTYIYQRLRIQDMIATAEISGAIGDSFVALPTRFLSPIWLRLDGDGAELNYVHEAVLDRFKDSDGNLYPGRFKQYAIINNRIEFDCEADDDFAGDICFYQQPAALATGANNTNFLTDRFPSLLIDTCMAFAWKARNRADMYQAQINGPMGVDAQIAQANISGDLMRMGQRLV